MAARSSICDVPECDEPTDAWLCDIHDVQAPRPPWAPSKSRCRHVASSKIYIRINHNGAKAAVTPCVRCGSTQQTIRLQIAPTDAPILYDLRSEIPCDVCRSRDGVELHHWAPSAIFGDEADDWPTGWLCRSCHLRWHQLVTPQWHGTVDAPTRRLA